MRTLLLVIGYEYTRHVRRRAFLLMALGLPLLLIVLGVIIGALNWLSMYREQALGLVDQTGRFAAIEPAALDLEQPLPMRVFADEAAARAAFAQGVIDAYVVIPADYLSRGQVRAVGRRALSEAAEDQLRALLRAGLTRDLPPERRARAEDPLNLRLRTLDSAQRDGVHQGLTFALPYALALLFVITTFTTSGYLLQALSEEKENRVMELLATSLSPTQMMAGKIIGLSAVGLTQMVIWVGMAALLGLGVAWRVGWPAGWALPWGQLALGLLFFGLGYLLVASLYTIAGAATTTPQEAQPLIAPVSLVMMVPFFLLVLLLAQPNGTLAVILSLIPLTAPLTMLMRLPLADVPGWQIALSALLLLLSTLAALWLAARVMRLGMLRYGKRLSLREMVGA
ncbi:ABC transporter permease [Kallotenue papyrolyticum]|uniref:ABC transporter permease n=1 Tax=Kallotenue papyrolyticum TaxID=1325125 RepID=UPI000492B335|nr:ABC transporter permease [Kallotenue papyrolyticum]